MTACLSQKAAFERAFGVKYVKSTACRHKSVWKKASKELRDEFLGMEGRGERGEKVSWGEFVRRVEGRCGRAGKGGGETQSTGSGEQAEAT